MFSTIYIEENIKSHPRAQGILERYSQVPQLTIERYGEIFNRKAQNFRLQKKHPALIIAEKHGKFVHEAPENYGIGGQRHFYFSHMLNCIYDCRYCFLQGMYRSANYVLFVNYEQFLAEIEGRLGEHNAEVCNFYSGYDCDSLALEPVSGFVDYFVPALKHSANAVLELRTKSTQVRRLLDMDVAENVVVAFSFTPQQESAALENKVPALDKRLDAMRKLQQKGWKVGLRFDPVIYSENFRAHYQGLFEKVFTSLENQQIHSVSLGAFRLPQSYYQNMVKLYPVEKLFAGKLVQSHSMISYTDEIEKSMMEFCELEIKKYVNADRYFPCHLDLSA